ncbi:homoserine dehydrogenase [Pseudemcibacter aquimaris]|uniref:homoserine dehydrogenase n=1 Tax=Pseudemcibacter aquimaris TaxID=2857064 RepID=UPI002012C5C6|nr:homoserine dehydrogenase [Pseudemcibacter aquimaris]MCC3860549.1 homoserine dehydrogenase [Pseudemcibacter aquimaris]WDU59373.1 homoserine dehydrogenase [Pseudemcibacter aquimaris]
MSDPLKVAVAGLGNVGVGVVKILEEHKEMIKDRAGREIQITAVSARSKTADRGVDLSPYTWVDNAADMADLDNVDIVVELIGGEEGIAFTLSKNALKNKKSLVTANKAMVAHHGALLADMAQENDVAMRYEAAVAGGIPIIKAIGEGLAANKLSQVYGIMNGTTNYMLTHMEQRGLTYDEILDEVTELGYLEADPALDLDGIDAAHKLAILSSVAFGTKTDFDNVYIEGIRKIQGIDIENSKEMGLKIKLLGMTKYENGTLSQRVHPVMIDRDLPIASVNDGFNALVVDGDYIDRTFYQGRGAGEGPTASAVVADLIDIARNHTGAAFFKPASKLVEASPVSINQRRGEYYVRILADNNTGVLADITNELKSAGVSVNDMKQKTASNDGRVYIIITTHETTETALKDAVNRIDELSVVLEPTMSIRIEKL